MSKKILYKTNHPLYGSQIEFTDWIQLCEESFELAQIEAQKRMYQQFLRLSEKISDEMIATVTEWTCES